MSAVSNSVMPRSIALWITLREVSRSVRWPKLLQPRPTAETRRPEPPRLRICMDRSCEVGREAGRILWPAALEAARCGPAARIRPARAAAAAVGAGCLRPAHAQRRRGHAPHRLFGVARDRLAIRAHVVGDRLAPAHGDVDGARRQHGEQMRDQVGVAVPRHPLAQAAAERHAAEADIGQRHRLHGDVAMMRGIAERVMHRADQRRAERQHADAVARGALGEQHHGVAAEQPAGDFPGRRAGLMPGLPVDEDRFAAVSPASRTPASPRPRFLATNTTGESADDHEDVQPRDMVGQDQRGAIVDRFPISRIRTPISAQRMR